LEGGLSSLHAAGFVRLSPSLPMTGTAINVAVILVAMVLARAGASGPPPVAAQRLRWFLAGLALYAGAVGILAVLEGPAAGLFRILAIAFASLLLGNITGRLLKLQGHLQTLGLRLTPLLPRPNGSVHGTVRWASLGVMLALNPLAVPAAVQDGLEHRWLGLAVKSILDAVSIAAYGRTLTWTGGGIVLLVIAGWQSVWSVGALACTGWLAAHGLRDPVLAEAGLLLVCAVPAIAGMRRANLADLTPGLFWAAALAALWRP